MNTVKTSTIVILIRYNFKLNSAENIVQKESFRKTFGTVPVLI